MSRVMPLPAAHRSSTLLSHTILITLLLLPIVTSLELIVPPGGYARYVPALIPRVVTQPRATRIAGTLDGRLHVSGTLSPATPGRNTVRLVVRRMSGAPVQGGHLDLVITMPRMGMAPVRATLVAPDGAYSGSVVLPMVGRYRARAVVTAPAGHYTGTLALVLSLPRR